MVFLRKNRVYFILKFSKIETKNSGVWRKTSMATIIYTNLQGTLNEIDKTIKFGKSLQ